MEIVYVNKASNLAEGLAKYLQEGFTVVNAPRPISGDKAWEGDYLRGVHYAASKTDRFLSHWKAYDAKQVVIVTNEEILVKLRQEAIDRGFTVERFNRLYQDKGEPFLEKYARSWLDMPYHPD
jgi:hypothetical protein